MLSCRREKLESVYKRLTSPSVLSKHLLKQVLNSFLTYLYEEIFQMSASSNRSTFVRNFVNSMSRLTWDDCRLIFIKPLRGR